MKKPIAKKKKAAPKQHQMRPLSKSRADALQGMLEQMAGLGNVKRDQMTKKAAPMKEVFQEPASKPLDPLALVSTARKYRDTVKDFEDLRSEFARLATRLNAIEANKDRLSSPRVVARLERLEDEAGALRTIRLRQGSEPKLTPDEIAVIRAMVAAVQPVR